jgi:polysaccharide chain length determinant protein (PEP-CTERM system associated)
MVPGKHYTLEDYLQIAWRRKWVLILPFLVASGGTLVRLRYVPDQYMAETVIQVVPQRVPEDYVRPTVTIRIEDRLRTINQQILSRTRLERVILDLNLYTEERKTRIMEDVVDMMRDDIDIEIPREGSTFRIRYTGPDPRAVGRVTERLASLFIEDNLRDREVLADGTNQFLAAQLEDARNRLIEHERRLEAYRRQHFGQLPSQLQTNLQAIQNTQLQIQTLVQSLNQDRDRRHMLERLLADSAAVELMPSGPVAAQPGSAGDASDPSGLTAAPAAQQLEAARSLLRAMRLRLTPKHPDIARLERTIRELEKKSEQEALQRPLAPEAVGPAQPQSAAEAATRNRLREMRAEIDGLDRRIAQKEGEEKRLRDAVAQYQARVEATPTREAELVELTRDYETLRGIYTSLLVKGEAAKVAANLERRHGGEQFRVLDRARVPEKPVTPDRMRIWMTGSLAGLGLGVLLALLLEYRDTSLRSERDVGAALALPVLALIPVMLRPTERARQRRRRQLVSVTAAVGLLVGAGVAVWKTGAWERWLR